MGMGFRLQFSSVNYESGERLSGSSMNIQELPFVMHSMWIILEWLTSNFKCRKGRVELAGKCAILAKPHVSYGLTNFQTRC